MKILILVRDHFSSTELDAATRGAVGDRDIYTIHPGMDDLDFDSSIKGRHFDLFLREPGVELDSEQELEILHYVPRWRESNPEKIPKCTFRSELSSLPAGKICKDFTVGLFFNATELDFAGYERQHALFTKGEHFWKNTDEIKFPAFTGDTGQTITQVGVWNYKGNFELVPLHCHVVVPHGVQVSFPQEQISASWEE